MFIVDRMILPPERKRHNDDESITVILFKKRDVNDRDKSLKTIKILPEDTKIVICDICSASLKSQVWLDHYKKSVHLFSVTKGTLQSQMSVRLSVRLKSKPF